MPFWRSWGAALLGASGAALAVPVGLLLLVTVVSWLSGGLGVGGLGQLTRGPELPGMSGRAPLPAAPLDGGLPGLPGTWTTERPGAGGFTSSSPGTGPGATTPDDGSGPGVASPGTPTNGTALPIIPAIGPGPPPEPLRPENPLSTVVQSVQGTVAGVPLVGRPVSDAVGTVTDLLLPAAAAPRFIP